VNQWAYNGFVNSSLDDRAAINHLQLTTSSTFQELEARAPFCPIYALLTIAGNKAFLKRDQISVKPIRARGAVASHRPH
jgi:hypothetical protein